METATAVITHPISLCAYVLALAFGLVAKKKGARFFYLAASLSVVALLGGLFVAWQQITKTSEHSQRPAAVGKTPQSVQRKDCLAAGSTTTQTSKGSQSPNIAETCGDVNVTFGAPSSAPSNEQGKKK
jgi:hypothetical protein